MNPLQFYQKYLTNNDLIRANIGLEAYEAIEDVEELAETLTIRSSEDYFLELVADELSDKEINLIRRLYRTTTLTNYYTVDYNPEKYPILAGFVLLIEDKGAKGVIHRSAVEGLMRHLPEAEKPATESVYLNKRSKHERDLLLHLSENLSLKRIIDVSGSSGLHKILRHLGFQIQFGQTEEEVVYGVLTNPEYLEQALITLPYEAVLSLRKAVEENDPFFRVDHKIGILSDYSLINIVGDHAFIYSEVFSTLKKLNLKRLAAVTRSGVDIREYNAMRVKVNLKGTHVPIERELIIPARLNFFELHLIIQRAVGWWTSHLAQFQAGNKFIHMYGTHEDNVEFAPPHTLHVSGIETMVDGILLERGELTYLYDYGDGWEHSVELVELLKEDGPVHPMVDKRKGPIPIEDSGGVGGFEETMAILNDENHPEHEDTAFWVQGTNYKKTYNKKQINKKLRELFESGAPILNTDTF